MPAPTTASTPSTRRTGTLVWEHADAQGRRSRQRQLGSDHRQRQDHHRPSVSARRHQRLLHRSPRTTRRRARRSGGPTRFRVRANRAYETWGDVPMEQRWHVGTWMVPSYDPETNMIFVGTSVTIPGAEVHARRRRQAAPLSQLDAGPRRRHRQDRLVLPAHHRQLGSRSSVRAPARRDRDRARHEGSGVDQSEDQAG